MRTTVELDERLVKEVMKILGVKTKREAIGKSLEFLLNYKRRERLRARLGKMDLQLSLEELEEIRRDG